MVEFLNANPFLQVPLLIVVLYLILRPILPFGRDDS